MYSIANRVLALMGPGEGCVMTKQPIPILEGVGRREERAQLVRSLQAALERMEEDRRPRDEVLVGSGCRALDQLLPEGGWRRGTVVEWLVGGAGNGAGTLALIVARQAALEGGVVVVFDEPRQFYPPAAAALGLDLEKLILVRPGRPADTLWALDQVLRCPGVAAAWAPLERLGERDFRRLQLAAESGDCLGMLLRPARVRGQPSWAHVQLLVEACHQELTPPPGTEVWQDGCGWRRLRVRRTRGRPAAVAVGEGRLPSVELEIDETSGIVRSTSRGHETHPLHLAPSLASPAVPRRSARA